MIDPREQTCGACGHYRPFADEPTAGICGGVPPQVKIWGTRRITDAEAEPLFVTVRPEVREDSPCCILFVPYGVEPIPVLPTEHVSRRSAFCKVPGCGCMRDGESDYCADHGDEDEPRPTESVAEHPECSLGDCPYSPASGICKTECEHPVDTRGQTNVRSPADRPILSESPE